MPVVEKDLIHKKSFSMGLGLTLLDSITYLGRAMSFGVDPRGEPCAWYSTDSCLEEMTIVPTGAPVPEGSSFVGTATWQGIVLHAFVRSLQEDEI